MRRKIVAVLLAMALVLSLAACGESGGTTPTTEPTQTSAPNEKEMSSVEPSEETIVTIEDFLDDKPGEITWTFENGILTVSGSGALDDNTQWDEYDDIIIEVVVEEGITSIGDSIFRGVDNLTSVILPKSVRRIGDYAFTNCELLKNISTTGSIIDVGRLAFYGTQWLKDRAPSEYVILDRCLVAYQGNGESASIPEMVVGIADSAFTDYVDSDGRYMYNKTLKSLIIPDSVLKIGEKAFESCNSLVSVSGGENVAIVEVDAFGGRYSETPWLASRTDEFVMLGSSMLKYNGNEEVLSIPVGVTCANCISEASITKISVPTSVLHLIISSYGMLTDLYETLEYIDVADNNSVYCSVDGVLYSKDMTKLIKYPSAKTDVSFQIPESVSVVNDEAFRGCKFTISLTIPKSVTYIGKEAFYGADFAALEIPMGIKIEKGALDAMSELTDIYFGGADYTAWVQTGADFIPSNLPFEMYGISRHQAVIHYGSLMPE